MPAGHSERDDRGAGPATEEAPVSAARQLFAAELHTITRLIATLTRRKYLSVEEAEDFESWAMVRLLDNDCAVLRKFTGRSSLPTYLTVVVANLFRDYRVQKWGKWRPSAEARRQGEVAVALERLVHRDGHPIDEASRMLRENLGVQLSEQELVDLYSTLPRRLRRPRGDESDIEALVDVRYADGAALDSERAEIAGRADGALREAMSALSSEDRVIMRLRFEEGFTVARIARSLKLEQKPLYERLKRVLGVLRDELERVGCGREQIERVWGWGDLDLRLVYELPVGKPRDESVQQINGSKNPPGWRR